jgi:hypothetical protein
MARARAPEAKVGPYRILSLDGGGIKGIVSVVLLERLSASVPGLLDEVDLIAGTSTGGLIALALGAGLDLATIRALYETKGGEIFDDSWLDDLKDLGRLVGAEYDISPLARELRLIFGNTRLADLERRVLIPSFDLDSGDPDPQKRSWKPKLFHNFPGSDSDGAQQAWKVGVYTSAAPTYFPAFEGYIDGGVYASNPAACALAQALDRRQRRPASLSRVVLLSVGSGTSLTFIRDPSLDWGYAQWARPLVSLMLDGVSGIADFQCRQILGARYHRLAPVFPTDKAYKMDEWRKVPEMAAFAEAVPIGDTVRFLRRHWTSTRARAART